MVHEHLRLLLKIHDIRYIIVLQLYYSGGHFFLKVAPDQKFKIASRQLKSLIVVVQCLYFNIMARFLT